MYTVILPRVAKSELLAFHIKAHFLQLLLNDKYIITEVMSCFVTSFFLFLGIFSFWRCSSVTDMSQLLLQEVAVDSKPFSSFSACIPSCAGHIPLLLYLWRFLEMSFWLISASERPENQAFLYHVNFLLIYQTICSACLLSGCREKPPGRA